VGGRYFDALIFGYREGERLMYAARTRSGFTPAVREQLHLQFQGLEPPECPFANLPEARGGRWGEGLTAAKMKDCRWLKPVLVGQFEFLGSDIQINVDSLGGTGAQFERPVLGFLKTGRLNHQLIDSDVQVIELVIDLRTEFQPRGFGEWDSLFAWAAGAEVGPRSLGCSWNSDE